MDVQNIVNTGDNVPIVPLIIFMALSLLLIAALISLRILAGRKKTDDDQTDIENDPDQTDE